tara:strand:- start:5981 stop:7945 length:1965 start_codon:yes stop_codon:yes gene_type:complete
MANLEKITIKFEAKGNKALQLAIMNLDVATKRLANQTSEYEKHLKGLGFTQRQANKLLSQQNKLTLFGVKNQRLLGNSFATVRSKLLLYSFAIGGAVALFDKFFGKTIIQEKAERKLEQALGKTSSALLNHASALQKVTTFGDESIISAQALLGAFIKDEEQIKLATEATLDLASAKGIDLKSAADLVSKTLGSTTNSLSRYGIKVEGAVGSTRRLESLTGSIAKLFGGQARAEADTLGGSVEQLSNVAGDASEALGKALQPVIEILVDDFTTLAEKSTNFFKSLSEFDTETMVRQFEELGLANENLIALKTISMFERLGFEQDKISNKINKTLSSNESLARSFRDIVDVEYHEWIRAGYSSFEEAVLPLENYDKMQKRVNDRIASLTESLMGKTQAQIMASQGEVEELKILTELSTMLEKYKQNVENTTSAIAKLVEGGSITAINFTQLINEAEMVANAIKGVADAYMNMELQNLKQNKEADLAAANNIRSEKKRAKEIDKINKEAAKEERKIRKRNQQFRIMDAIANTAVGITKAMELPTPTNFIMAALIGAQGAIQVATLKAQKFERGGMVGGRRHSQGGTMIEAERGEFVMSRSAVESVGLETMNRINQGGGAGVNVSFSGNVMSDDFVENEAIPKIKEAIRRGADIGVS